MSSSLYTVSLSVNDPTALQKPTHIVMWQDSSTDTLANLTERLASLEKAVASLTGTGSVSASSASCPEGLQAKSACLELGKRSPLISGISMERSADCSGNLCAVVDTVDAAALMREVIEKPFVLESAMDLGEEVNTDICPDDEVEEEDNEALVDEDEDELPEEEEAVEEEAVEEEAEEEEAVEYEEIEYKGVTYYKDSENQVYVLDADGDLDDAPVGVWNEEKKKVLKYAKA